MTGCREFVQRLGVRRNLVGVLVTAALAAPQPDNPIRVHAFAREFAPGEAVRFEVFTDPRITSVSGTFEGGSLAFVRNAGAASEPSWIAWGVVPLEAAAGPAPYRMTAKRNDGASSEASGEITIAAKSFPEQRLTVESKFVNPPKAELGRIERERKKLAAIYATRTPLAPPSSAFVRPVDGEETSEFGTRRFFNGEPRSPHPGLDLHATMGTPVAASGPGRVVLASDLYYSGGTVIIDHGGGLFTIYAHLSKIEAKTGATIHAGDRVGLSGATGRVTGPHLHWGARVGEVIFDPRALLDPRLFGGQN